ncbi:uncharacterized protein LOC121415993 isoform X2 [Lytechinus variegatus]|uniref:uncharacterized protein LOC121415993 isoform X2 n=1 Tax=Lytechinus variegatus TaxID=7654 RepID=UPI001BB0D939|nr:uncharacterized protein LOC121415993 isoform X2 [Lytechinus variegatus]
MTEGSPANGTGSGLDTREITGLDTEGTTSNVPTVSKERNRTLLTSPGHTYEPDSKDISSSRLQNISEELNRPLLRFPSKSVNHSRTHALGAARFILTVLVPCAALLVTLSMAFILISWSNAQARLLERVALLEERLSEVSKSCNCRMPTDGESGQRGSTNGERRENKFAFLMASGHGKVLGVETESKPDGDIHSLHDVHSLNELKEVLETVTPEIHPKILIKLENARSTSPASSEVPDSSTPASKDDTRASLKSVPVIPKDSESEGARYRRGGKKRGRDRNQSDEQAQRARSVGAVTREADRNSTEIRGVHFQANLNRTTTIGVGEGWVPYWALSSSLLNAGSAGYMDEIKREFRLSARGNVTVRTPGLYYVYSQMMYYDPNEYIGHSIVIDGVEAFTCIAPISEQTSKYKTCFIGGLVYLPPRTKVAIKMLYTPRRVCLFEDTSYFGMFRVT